MKKIGHKQEKDIIQISNFSMMFKVWNNPFRVLWGKRCNEEFYIQLIDESDIAFDYLKKEKSNRILSILNNMKEEYKSILILKYDMELSYKEIALLLGTNEDVVKTYMYRARNKFKEEWRMINE